MASSGGSKELGIFLCDIGFFFNACSKINALYIFKGRLDCLIGVIKSFIAFLI